MNQVTGDEAEAFIKQAVRKHTQNSKITLQKSR